MKKFDSQMISTLDPSKSYNPLTSSLPNMKNFEQKLK